MSGTHNTCVLEVYSEMACEIEKWKQALLMYHVLGPDTCVFADVTLLDNEKERHCVRHKEACVSLLSSIHCFCYRLDTLFICLCCFHVLSQLSNEQRSYIFEKSFAFCLVDLRLWSMKLLALVVVFPASLCPSCRMNQHFQSLGKFHRG